MAASGGEEELTFADRILSTKSEINRLKDLLKARELELQVLETEQAEQEGVIEDTDGKPPFKIDFLRYISDNDIPLDELLKKRMRLYTCT